MTVAPVSETILGSRSPSTDRESRSIDLESDSDPGPTGDLETRSLVKVVSGEGFPESTEMLSLEVAGGRDMTVDRTCPGGVTTTVPGAWLIECLCGRALERGGVTGGHETELWDLCILGLELERVGSL